MIRTVISDKLVLVAADNIESAELGGEMVLLDVSAGEYYGLNELGSLIMTHLKEPLSVAEVKERIQSTFDVEKEQLEEDLNAFLEEMIKYKLIKIEDS